MVLKILDIGCGAGEWTNHLNKIKENVVWGIDPSRDNINICVEKNNKINYQICSAEKMKFKENFFDEIHMNEVLEHVDNLHLVLKKIKKILKPHGKLHISVPNKESELMLLKIHPNYPNEIGHKHIFSKRKFLFLLQENKFRLLKYKKYNSFEHIYWKILFKKGIPILNQNARIDKKNPFLKFVKESLNQDNFYIYKERGLKNKVFLLAKIILLPLSRILDHILINKKQMAVVENE